MKNFPIRTKLLLILGVCACFLTILTIAAIIGFTTQKQAINEIVYQRFARYTDAMNLYAAVLKIAVTLHELNLNIQKEMSLEEFEAQTQGIRAMFEREIAQMDETLQHTTLAEQERQAFERVSELLKSYQTAAVLALRNRRNQALFVMQLKNLQVRQNAIEQEVVTLRDYEAQSSQQTYERAGKLVIKTLSIFIGISAFCLMCLFMLTRVILRSTAEPIREAVVYAQRIANGDLSMEITVNRRDEAGQLLAAMQHMIDRIKAIAHDLGRLTDAAKAGNLGVRADTSTHRGEFATIVQGVNDTLDAVISPLHTAADFIKRIANGDIPDAIVEEYHGDFASIKDSLNLLIGATQSITALAESMARGDWTAEVSERSPRDALMQSLNTMLLKLNDTVLNVKTAVANVSSGSENMSSAAEQMSQGAAQQAAAAEEASASMEQMVANIRQNTDNAQIMEKIAVESALDARQGGEAVERTIDAMKTIADRISVIQEIAGQTNILSINATIEAAKAEDYGKGFAVVATEVRTLAGRSRKAAEEIEQLVASCVAVSEEAGRVLRRLVPNSEKTAQIVQEITAAGREQLVGAEHVNLAIQQLDQVIQENAATSEEMASSAETLATQAKSLQEVTAFFTVRERVVEPLHTEDQELLKAIQTIRAAQAIDATRLQSLIQQIAFSNVFAPTAPNGTHPPHEAHASHSVPANWHDPALENRRQNGVVGDSRDDEFERY